MLSIRLSNQTTIVETGGWAELLDGDERHIARQGFGAGVLVVYFGDELLRHVDEDTRSLTETAVIAIIDRHLGRTDRTKMIAPGRLGVVVVPVEGVVPLARRARELHRDLRDCGLDVGLAYSLRRDSGGLSATAARADAAIDTILSRRASAGR